MSDFELCDAMKVMYLSSDLTAFEEYSSLFHIFDSKDEREKERESEGERKFTILQNEPSQKRNIDKNNIQKSSSASSVYMCV